MPKSSAPSDLGRFCCLGLVLAAAGCGARPRYAPAPVPVPVFAPEESRVAVRSGARALADLRGERARANLGSRAPDYAKAREELSRSLAALQPAKLSPKKPELERAAVCLETALAAIDEVIAARGADDPRAEEVGWEMFDQSAQALLLVLEDGAVGR